MHPTESHTPSLPPADVMAVVPADVLDQMRQQIEYLVDLLGRQATGACGPGYDYQEPGPHARRKFGGDGERRSRPEWIVSN